MIVQAYLFLAHLMNGLLNGNVQNVIILMAPSVGHVKSAAIHQGIKITRPPPFSLGGGGKFIED